MEYVWHTYGTFAATENSIDDAQYAIFGGKFFELKSDDFNEFQITWIKKKYQKPTLILQN